MKTVYAIRHEDGRWFSGSRWSGKLDDARIFTVLGTTRTWATKLAKSGNVTDIVFWNLTENADCQIIDGERERVAKVQERKAQKDAEEKRRRASEDAERARKEILRQQELLDRAQREAGLR